MNLDGFTILCIGLLINARSSHDVSILTVNINIVGGEPEFPSTHFVVLHHYPSHTFIEIVCIIASIFPSHVNYTQTMIEVVSYKFKVMGDSERETTKR